MLQNLYNLTPRKKLILAAGLTFIFGFVGGQLYEQSSYQREIAGRILGTVEQPAFKAPPPDLLKGQIEAFKMLGENVDYLSREVVRMRNQSQEYQTRILQKLEELENASAPSSAASMRPFPRSRLAR